MIVALHRPIVSIYAAARDTLLTALFIQALKQHKPGKKPDGLRLIRLTSGAYVNFVGNFDYIVI